MIGGVRCGKTGELVVLRPVKVTGVHDYAAHDRPVAADELCGGVDDDVRAVLNGSQQVGRGEGAVDDQRNTVAVRNFRDGFQIDDVGIRIAERFGIEQLCVRLDGGFKIRGVGGIDEADGQPLLVQGVGEEVVRAAVEVGRGDNVVARDGDVLNGVGDGRRAGGGGQRACAALQRGNAALEDIGGGVHQAGIDIARLGQAKAPGGLRGVLEDIGGRGVNGDGSGVGCGIGRFLSGVDLDGFKTIRHDN